jgi:hypothetical protein
LNLRNPNEQTRREFLIDNLKATVEALDES